MTSEQFVACLYREKSTLLREYFDPNSQSECGRAIRSLELSNTQMKILRGVLDTALTDAYYGVILGLDGAASLGGEQHLYKLLNEEGQELTGGSLEGPAWTHFQE